MHMCTVFVVVFVLVVVALVRACVSASGFGSHCVFGLGAAFGEGPSCRGFSFQSQFMLRTAPNAGGPACKTHGYRSMARWDGI